MPPVNDPVIVEESAPVQEPPLPPVEVEPPLVVEPPSVGKSASIVEPPPFQLMRRAPDCNAASDPGPKGQQTRNRGRDAHCVLTELPMNFKSCVWIW